MPATARLLDRDQFNALVRSTRRNADVFTRLTYLDHSALRDDDQSQFVMTDARKTIIAAASVMPDPRNATRLWVLGVSVDGRHRNQGHATTLLRGIFAHAAKRGMTVELSRFSDDGQTYLAPLVSRLHAEVPDLRLATSSHPQKVFTGHTPSRIDSQGQHILK